MWRKVYINGRSRIWNRMLNIKMLNLIVLVKALRPVTEMTIDVEGYVAERRPCRGRRIVTIIVYLYIV